MVKNMIFLVFLIFIIIIINNILAGGGAGVRTSAGLYSGFWTQSAIVACWSHATVGRHFGEATVPEEECGPCTVSVLYLGIRITTKEKPRKTLKSGWSKSA